MVSGLKQFQGTRWQEALETLCQRYWKPVYLYLRIAAAKSNEDAKDLSQAFFAWLIEGHALGRYDAERGSFRQFLKVLLRRFLSHQEESMGALKRGGGSVRIPLDAVLPTLEGAETDPEMLFEQAWRTEVMNQARDRLRDRLTRDGDSQAFQIYEEYVLAPAIERPTYAALAERLKIREQDVKACLIRVRRRLQSEIRSDLARLAPGQGELEEEWNALFRG
jgi:RNA polymerase sigma factor (sigma-70 family)